MKINNSGLTLIELMVVIIVIVIISMVVVPQFISMVETAKQATTKGYIATLRKATDIYFIDNNFYPYKYSELPYIDADNNEYTSINSGEEKNNNAWVPRYLNLWPLAIRIAKSDWGLHENGNDMKIVNKILEPKTNHNWNEEIIYNCITGEIYINCNLKDKEGEYIYEW